MANVSWPIWPHYECFLFLYIVIKILRLHFTLSTQLIYFVYFFIPYVCIYLFMLFTMVIVLTSFIISFLPSESRNIEENNTLFVHAYICMIEYPLPPFFYHFLLSIHEIVGYNIC